MKKKILTAFTALTLALGAIGGSIPAFADASLEECDLCFQQTANAILQDDEVKGTQIISRRRPLYDLNLNVLGYEYSFDAGYGDGYAIVVCDDGNYVAQEFIKNGQSPYAGVSEDELCVYVQAMTYFKSVNGEICDIETSVPLSQASVEILREDAILYRNGIENGYEEKTVRVDFVSKSYEHKMLCYGAPVFDNCGLTGGCAAVAGGNLIGYYDRFYEDLIPNHQAGISNGELFLYNFADEYVYQAINTLYDDMGGSAGGISENGFKSGMKAYCSRKGLSCDFTSLKNSGSLNYSSVKTCINDGYPLVLLLNTYTICKMSDKDTYANIYYEIHHGNHVMPGFGFSNVKYTHSDGSVSDYRMINVTTGWTTPREALFNIDYCTNIISAYKVNIH